LGVTIDSEGQTIWIVDAHGYGKRFIVRADELRTAFVELESAVRARSELTLIGGIAEPKAANPCMKIRRRFGLTTALDIRIHGAHEAVFQFEFSKIVLGEVAWIDLLHASNGISKSDTSASYLRMR
jgi:hypothetical protein